MRPIDFFRYVRFGVRRFCPKPEGGQGFFPQPYGWAVSLGVPPGAPLGGFSATPWLRTSGICRIRVGEIEQHFDPQKAKDMSTTTPRMTGTTPEPVLPRGGRVSAMISRLMSLFGSGWFFALAATLSVNANPINDYFTNRITLIGTNLITAGTNVGATKEPGEPDHAGNTGGASVWWTWTAPANGTLRIATTNSDFDTVLGVYTGSSVSNLTLVASDDDSGGRLTSLVDFDVTGGTDYQIAVDGFGGASGSISLTVAFAPPPIR